MDQRGKNGAFEQRTIEVVKPFVFHLTKTEVSIMEDLKRPYFTDWNKEDRFNPIYVQKLNDKGIIRRIKFNRIVLTDVGVNLLN